MRQATVKVYEFHELEESVQEKVIQDMIEVYQELPFMEFFMYDELNQQLAEHGIKYPQGKDAKLYYSLSYSQGDGLMFEIKFDWEHDGQTWLVEVKHSGHYYHKYSRIITITDDDCGDELDDDHKVYKDFVEMYESICDHLEQYGYDHIESETSREHAEDDLNNNGAEYFADGRIFFEEDEDIQEVTD